MYNLHSVPKLLVLDVEGPGLAFGINSQRKRDVISADTRTDQVHAICRHSLLPPNAGSLYVF